MFFDIVQPKAMALSAGIGGAMGADALDFVEQGAVCKSCPAQFGPVAPAAATDHVVYGGERKALVIQVTVLHGLLFPLRDGADGLVK